MFSLSWFIIVVRIWWQYPPVSVPETLPTSSYSHFSTDLSQNRSWSRLEGRVLPSAFHSWISTLKPVLLSWSPDLCIGVSATPFIGEQEPSQKQLQIQTKMKSTCDFFRINPFISLLLTSINSRAGTQWGKKTETQRSVPLMDLTVCHRLC